MRMIKIAITRPGVVSREVERIKYLLANDVDFVHLRKPDVGVEYCVELLEQLTSSERGRVVVHDHYSLYEEFALRGVHLNRNISELPAHYSGSRTRSCHSFEEVLRYRDECDYLFLSPLFDSISKHGYRSAFTHEELLEASRRGIIDKRVIALGGVSPERFAYLEELSFGGVAMVGALWSEE